MHSHDKETVGPSVMVPGILPKFHNKEMAPAVCTGLCSCNGRLYDVRYGKVRVGSFQLCFSRSVFSTQESGEK